MKVLVYGAGVIGGQLAHALIVGGNEVTVIARGAWKETLEKDGLRIRHYIQRKDTVDHPRILEKPDGERYDIAFAVMQFRQMEAILDDLAAVNSPIVVLVGNNLSVDEMESRIRQASAARTERLRKKKKPFSGACSKEADFRSRGATTWTHGLNTTLPSFCRSSICATKPIAI